MNILVVGATGLLGGRLSESLMACGHRVIHGVRDFEKKSYFNNNHVEILLIDLDNFNIQNCDFNEIDLIICLAGLNSEDSQLFPNKAMFTRGGGTKKLIDEAVRSGVKKFIYISSAHVYRNPLIGIFDEKSPVLNNNIYALSHLAAENNLINSIKNGDIDGIILRISNGFGKPVDKRVNCWDLLINDLCRQGIEIGELKLRDDGSSIRNYISISEICRAINYCVENLPFHTENDKTLIANLGGKMTLTTLEVANIIKSRFIQTMQISPPIFFTNNPKADRSTLNVTKSLTFKNNVLERAGYLSKDNFIDEIDLLIDFCHKNFSKI